MNAVNIQELPFVGFQDRRNFPEQSGIYFALSESDVVLYIGKAVNIANRWAAHHRDKQLTEMGCARLAWLTMDDVDLLYEVESALIKHFQPLLNGTEVEYKNGQIPIVLRVDKNLIARLDAALEKLAGPYKPPSRNSALQVAIREHIEKLEKEQK